MFSLVPFSDRISERNAIFLHFNSTTLGLCSYLRETDANTVCKRSELFPLPPPPMILLVHTSRLSSQMLIIFIPLMQNASDSTSNRYPFSRFEDDDASHFSRIHHWQVSCLVRSIDMVGTNIAGLCGLYPWHTFQFTDSWLMRHAMSSCQTGTLPIIRAETAKINAFIY